jgi:hypothetical protein
MLSGEKFIENIHQIETSIVNEDLISDEELGRRLSEVCLEFENIADDALSFWAFIYSQGWKNHFTPVIQIYDEYLDSSRHHKYKPLTLVGFTRGLLRSAKGKIKLSLTPFGGIIVGLSLKNEPQAWGSEHR